MAPARRSCIQREKCKTVVFMAGHIRDGTGRYCFDMFGGKFFEDGTGRDGKNENYSCLDWTGRDSGFEVSRREDGRAQLTFVFHDGTGQ